MNKLMRGLAMKYNKDFWALILASVAIFSALVWAGTSDFEVEAAQDQQYCEMVAIWNLEASQNILPIDRNGWPPYNSRINCE